MARAALSSTIHTVHVPTRSRRLLPSSVKTCIGHSFHARAAGAPPLNIRKHGKVQVIRPTDPLQRHFAPTGVAVNSQILSDPHRWCFRIYGDLPIPSCAWKRIERYARLPLLG